MIRQISIKTKFGWISAFEDKNRIVRIAFGKFANRRVSKNLRKLKNGQLGKLNIEVSKKYLKKNNKIAIF